MKNNPLPRLDDNAELRERLLPFCRLQPGEIWDDPDGRHRIGCKTRLIPSRFGNMSLTPDQRWQFTIPRTTS